MKRNNFKELEDSELEKLDFNSTGVQSRINSTMGIVRFVTDVIDLYIPRVLDTVVQMFNGEGKTKEEKK